MTGMEPIPAPPAHEELAQPTRARLFALLAEHDRPISTGELAQRLALHRNGVRVHLERMAQAGLVERARRPQGRGRPPDLWTLSPQARDDSAAPERYQELGRWLARALAAPEGGTAGIERTGREIGRELAPADAAEPAQALQRTLVRLGFRPAQAASPPDTLTMCLGNCPYREAVHENQPAICSLHRGITIGLLDKLAPGATLTGFVPRNPDTAGCVVEVSGLPVDPVP